jgi:hypothetical protein
VEEDRQNNEVMANPGKFHKSEGLFSEFKFATSFT